MQSNIFFDRVPKNAPKYNAVPTYTGDARGSVENKYNIYSKSKRQHRTRTRTRETVNDRFIVEYCSEIDIFDSQTRFPEWIYDFREQNLHKIGRNFRLLSQILKEEGVDFKLKYPIEVDGKWKFADAYLPKYNAVVLLMSEREYIGLPCWSKSDRELFFEDRCKVIAILPYELPKLRDKLNTLRHD